MRIELIYMEFAHFLLDNATVDSDEIDESDHNLLDMEGVQTMYLLVTGVTLGKDSEGTYYLKGYELPIRETLAIYGIMFQVNVIVVRHN